MHATIYHNPDCGTSRNTLAMIRHAGIEPTVVEYLHAPPTGERLLELIPSERLAGFVYIGSYDEAPGERVRPPLAERVSYYGE